MERIVLDEQTRSKLNGLRSPAEFCDSAGKQLGYFLSPDLYARMLDALYRDEDVDPAELDRIANESGGRSLQAILADLEKK
jgi:hypothetical protein